MRETTCMLFVQAYQREKFMDSLLLIIGMKTGSFQAFANDITNTFIPRGSREA